MLVGEHDSESMEFQAGLFRDGMSARTQLANQLHVIGHTIAFEC